MTKIALINNEPLEVQRLKRCIERHNLENPEIVWMNSPLTAVQYLTSTDVDLLFINADQEDGAAFSVLNNFSQRNFKVVLTAGDVQYALKAFKYNVLDYILSSSLEEEIPIVLDRFEREREVLKSNRYEDRSKTTTRKIRISSHDGVGFIDEDSIARCEAESNYTILYTKEGEKKMICKTLKEFETMLSAKKFFRIHRSHLVNVAFVKRIQKGNALLVDKTLIPISRLKKEELIQCLQTL
jgi:two-component system LytT family response regulator